MNEEQHLQNASFHCCGRKIITITIKMNRINITINSHFTFTLINLRFLRLLYFNADHGMLKESQMLIFLETEVNHSWETPHCGSPPPPKWTRKLLDQLKIPSLKKCSTTTAHHTGTSHHYCGSYCQVQHAVDLCPLKTTQFIYIREAFNKKKHFIIDIR